MHNDSYEKNLKDILAEQQDIIQEMERIVGKLYGEASESYCVEIIVLSAKLLELTRRM